MITPPMKTSDNGRHFIELWEGLILGAYDDFNDHVVKPGEAIRGTLTIGYGHTTAAGLPRVYPGMVITAAQADAILASDLASVEADINHHVTVPTGQLSQDMYDMLASFDFNTGALDRSNVLAAINSGKLPATIEADLCMWDNAGGHPNMGLLRRRRAEFILGSTGKVIGP